MQIIPAVDLRGGACVQLVGGDPNKEVVRHNNPEAKINEFAYHGAHRIHIVDLDRAMGSGGSNTDLIKAILSSRTDLQIQVGGGIRSISDIEELLEAGADKVITGTRALMDPVWFKEAAGNFGAELMLAIDAKNRDVVVNGWKAEAGMSVLDASLCAQDNGISGIIYTDAQKEGQMQGPNIEVCTELAASLGEDVEFLAGGGIGRWEDIVNLGKAGVNGVIIGTPAYLGPLALNGLFD